MAIIDPRHAAKQLIYERIFRSATLSAAVLVLLILGGVAVSLVRGAWPALSHFGFSFVSRGNLESGHRPIRRARADLRHGGHLRHCHAAGGAGGIRYRPVPDRNVPAAAQAAHRRRRRIAGCGTQHHFRHLGAVRAGAGAAAACAAVADRTPRACTLHRRPVQRPALRHRHSDGGRGSRHHGAAFHCRHHARCVRHRAAHAQGVRLRTRRHHLGSDLECGRAALAGRHRRRHHAGTRPRPGRDHGGDLRHRQCAPHQLFVAGARHHHLVGDCQRVHRSGGRFVYLLAHRPGVAAVFHHLHGDCGRAGDAAQTGAARGAAGL